MMFNRTLVHRQVTVPFDFAQDRHGTGCIRNILVPHPSGSKAVQIGCPADLSGSPCRNDDFLAKMRIAEVSPVSCLSG